MLKKSSLVVLSVALYGALCSELIAADAQKSNSNETSDYLTMTIGREELPVTFEKSKIPDEFKQTIINDLELNFSRMDKVEFKPVRSREKAAPTQKYNRVITYLLDTGEQKSSLPDVLKRYFGGAVKPNDNYLLLIHTKVIEAYEKALKRKKEHPNMLNKLNEFLNLLQDKDKLRELAENPKRAKSKIYFYNKKPPKNPSAYNQLLNYADDNYSRPSLLDIKPLKAVVEDDSLADDVFVCFSYITYTYKNREYGGRYPLGVFKDNEWHFFVPDGI